MLEDQPLEDGLGGSQFLGCELVERLQDELDALVLGAAFLLVEDQRISRNIEGDNQSLEDGEVGLDMAGLVALNLRHMNLDHGRQGFLGKVPRFAEGGELFGERHGAPQGSEIGLAHRIGLRKVAGCVIAKMVLSSKLNYILTDFAGDPAWHESRMLR